MATPRPERKTNSTARDIRGTLGAIVFIIVGVVAWWQIHDAPSDQAAVFPLTVISLMVVFSVLLILRNLLGYGAPEGAAASGSVWRRVALVVAMILATVVMPYIGFVISALAAYIAIMAIAMYERWTGPRLLLYPAAGVVVVLGFYFIFQTVFQVPLPEPSLFNWPF